MGLLTDIKTLLTSIESNIFRGDYPDTPDSMIALYNSGGYIPDLTHDGSKYENPTFQVRIRSATYDAGINKCESIKDVLANVTNRIINGNTYLSIRQMGDLADLGRDERNRAMFSLNFVVKVARN